MNLFHISFSDKSFYKSQQELVKSALRFGINNTIIYNDLWLRNQISFYDQNKTILQQKRGAGFWLWKPFIILDALKKINENDVLIYTDSGSLFINSITDLINLLNFNDIILFNNNDHTNQIWTKRDCFFYMNCDYSSFHESNQIVASYIVCKKTPFVVNLITEWLFYAQDPRILTDMSNTCGLSNLKGFIEHRHDQSILSILAHKYKIELFRDPSQWGNKFKHIRYREEGEFVENGKYIDDAFPNSNYATILNSHRIKYKLTFKDQLDYMLSHFKYKVS